MEFDKVLKLAEENESRAVWFTPGCGQNLICKNSAAAIRALVEVAKWSHVHHTTTDAAEKQAAWTKLMVAHEALADLNDGLQ